MKVVQIVALFLFLGCAEKNKQAEQPDVLTLKEMSELATAEYTITKIIKANDNQTWFKPGDRKILMSCEATIKAGVDLSTLSEKDFEISSNTINLRLPNPKVISLNIAPEKIKVEYQQVGLFRDPFKAQERDALATQAENQIRNSITELGIIEQAKTNTSLFVSNFLKQLGYQNINISYANAATQIPVQ